MDQTPADRYATVRGDLTAACTAAGRDPTTVRLLAVSKAQPSEALRALHQLGQRAFGEK